MKHKTSDLTGALLDAAVAMALGWPLLDGDTDADGTLAKLSPSTDWAIGGPILEREHLRVEWHSDGGGFWRSVRPAVVVGDWPISKNGSTALEAAMRAYVASKMGDEVELP